MIYKSKYINMLLDDDSVAWSYDCASALVDFLVDIYKEDINKTFDVDDVNYYYTEYASIDEALSDFDHELTIEQIEKMTVAKTDKFILIFKG